MVLLFVLDQIAKKRSAFKLISTNKFKPVRLLHVVCCVFSTVALLLIYLVSVILDISSLW